MKNFILDPKIMGSHVHQNPLSSHVDLADLDKIPEPCRAVPCRSGEGGGAKVLRVVVDQQNQSSHF